MGRPLRCFGGLDSTRDAEVAAVHTECRLFCEVGRNRDGASSYACGSREPMVPHVSEMNRRASA